MNQPLDQARKEAERSREELARALEKIAGALGQHKLRHVAVENALHTTKSGIDGLAQEIEHSLRQALNVLDDRRAAAWMTVFFAGCLLGSQLSRKSRF